MSCGIGSKGPRLYDWAITSLNCPDPEQSRRWLLIRRSVTDPTEIAYFVCGGPPGTTLDELVRIAGTRWAIEECFELAKGDCGLDEYEVRSWIGWHQHVTLSLFALAAATVIRSRVGQTSNRKKGAAADPVERTRSTDPAPQTRLDSPTAAGSHARLVDLAPNPPAPNPSLSLPKTTRRTTR